MTAADLESRIDVYPTHEHQGSEFRRGRPFPFGATPVPGGVNFSVFSSAARSCTLVLFASMTRSRWRRSSFPVNSESATSMP